MEPWKSPHSAAVLVGYDCPGTREGERRRRQLRKICKPRMERVQYSVYLGTVPRTDIPGMEENLRCSINEAFDRLLIADLGAGVWRSHGQGMPAVRLPPAALIVVAESSASLAAAATATRTCHHARQGDQGLHDPRTPQVIQNTATIGPCERVGRGLDHLGGQIVGFIDWLRSL